MRRVKITGPDLIKVDSAEITITDGWVDGDELTILKPPNGLSVSYYNATKTLYISGIGEIEDYRKAIADVGFRSSSCVACTKPRKISVRAKGRGDEYWSNTAYSIVYLFDLCGGDGRWGAI
jgi:hypothetical protein